jgi:UDP-glucose 4-epimerase
MLYREIARQMQSELQPICGAARAGDLHRSLLNADKAKNVLGWSAKFSLAEGIAETIAFFRAKENSK